MSETIVINAPPAALLESAATMLAVAAGYRIDCPELREAAGEDLARVKRLAKDLEAERRAITVPLDTAKARVMDHFRKPAKFLEDAERILKQGCLAYDDEQAQKRAAAEAEAAQVADEERKRLAAEAQRQSAAGNVETAHAIAAAAEMVAPVPVAVFAPTRVAGEAHRVTWRADRETVDVIALARAVADGVIAPDNLCPNWPVIDGQVRALKGAFKMPGVRAVSERVLAARAAAA